MSEYKIRVTTRAQGKNDTQYFSRHEIEGYSISVQARLKKAKHNHAALFCCCKTPPIPMHIEVTH